MGRRESFPVPSSNDIVAKAGVPAYALRMSSGAEGGGGLGGGSGSPGGGGEVGAAGAAG